MVNFFIIKAHLIYVLDVKYYIKVIKISDTRRKKIVYEK